MPKVIVRLKPDYDVGEYYSKYLLEHLQAIEVSANSKLVTLLRNGDRRVYKKDLMTKYGTGKNVIVDLTRQYPEVLARYRERKRTTVHPPLEHLDFADATGTELPDWDRLLGDVTALPTGIKDATRYHRAVERLISALFSNDLSSPELEEKIHEGRKRIDISYANAAGRGFFKMVGDRCPAPFVFVECKNYSRDLANPELDQMQGRFSPRRGRFGIVVCRQIVNRELFSKRCRDTADDDRGFIIGLDDQDLIELVDFLKGRPFTFGEYPLLMERYKSLVM